MKFLAFTLTLFLFISCIKDKEIDYVVLNDEQINDYITQNNLDAQKSSTGLYYIIDELGAGTQPNQNSDVTVAYKGYFLDGDVFDQSNAEGITFNLQGVIKGWTEGIAYFKEGGSGVLLVPAHLGYGNKGRGSIPGGAVLVFDIELLVVD